MQLVMAHPDDEVIFGWPVLKQVSSILICSNDKNNPERAWCRYRYKALEEIGELLGIPVVSLDYDSEFYKLNARNGSLKRFIDDVLSHIDPHADTIFTHNWMGEYGHLDHILVYYIMLMVRNENIRLMTSDILLQSEEWLSFNQAPLTGHPAYRYRSVTKNDLHLYDGCKAIYDKYGLWTWNQDPVLKCQTIIL